jgi:DNA-binding transcriptional LysR family regulator
VCRLDPLRVLVPESHTLAALPRVPLVALAGEPLVLGSERRSAGLNQFLIELCRSAGFVPRLYPGSVDTVRAAADLVAQRRCVACVPASGLSTCLPGVVQKPVIEPEAHYPWSILWRANNNSQQVRTVRSIAHELSRTLGWRDETPESQTSDCAS